MKSENRNSALLVKETREKFGVSIEGAHDLIVVDPEMKRLVRVADQPQYGMSEASALGCSPQKRGFAVHRGR